MQSIQFIRQRTIVKLAIIVLFIKVAFFHYLTSNDTSVSVAPNEYQISTDELTLYKDYWSPELGEQLGLTQKEYRVKRRQHHWRRKQEGGGSTSDLKVEDDLAFIMHDDLGSHRNDINIPPTMGYYNLSCPFEWYKYSCAAIQDNEVDEQVTAASMQYYQQHLAEIFRAFHSVSMNHPQQQQQQQPKRILMTGDSLLRQLFISLACNAYSLNIIEQSEIQWREE